MPAIDRLLTPKRSLYAAKTAEADKVLAGIAGTGAGATSTYSSPLLAPEAQRKGMTEVALARSVRTKAAAGHAAVAAVEVLRQAAQAEIDAAPRPAAIEAVLARIAAQIEARRGPAA